MTPTARPPRARARRGDGERLRAEILAATERLLIQTGDQEAVSIRAIADAVGVTPPSIYLHFADKTELLFAVCEKHFEVLDRQLEDAGETFCNAVVSLHGMAALNRVWEAPDNLPSASEIRDPFTWIERVLQD